MSAVVERLLKDPCSHKKSWSEYNQPEHAMYGGIIPTKSPIYEHAEDASSEGLLYALELRFKVKQLEEEVENIHDQLNRRSVIVPIQSFEPFEFEVTKPILAVVQEEDGVFIASFFDANINASGESQLDAIEMLKDMIVSSYQILETNEKILSTEPQRQLAILRNFIRAR